MPARFFGEPIRAAPKSFIVKVVTGIACSVSVNVIFTEDVTTDSVNVSLRIGVVSSDDGPTNVETERTVNVTKLYIIQVRLKFRAAKLADRDSVQVAQ